MDIPYRIARTKALDAPVTSVRFVTGKRSAALEKLGIRTVRDLFENYPRRYLDMSTVVRIAEAEIGSSVTVVGQIGEINVKRPKPRMTIVEASVIDESGVMFLTWFGQPWMADKLAPGDEVSVSGKMDFGYSFKRMNSPYLEILQTAADKEETLPAGRIIALHPGTANLSEGWIKRLLIEAFDMTSGLLDPLPASLRCRRNLISRETAWRLIHMPVASDDIERARSRIIYEELLLVQLFLVQSRRMDMGDAVPIRHRVDGPKLEAMRAALGFPLTTDQESAVADILSDMAADVRMSRMLLGDVGTGKTAVAALALAAAVDSGHQGAMMAPTTVLARQYAAKLGPLFDRCGISWAVMTGATGQKERERIQSDLRDGTLDVLMGTHALIQEDVVFSDLSLAIIDEQHRFGVNQRSALQTKGESCDVLIMTATPIPRTLALVLYGDLSCSYLRERPIKHASTVTKVLKPSERNIAYDEIRRQVGLGHQAYIVCPLVGKKSERVTEDDDEPWIDEEADVSEPKAAISHAAMLKKKVFPGLRLSLMTGRLQADEKAAVMEAFAHGDTDILVSTTVVEVGVDVGNATVMVIEDADRFGLSQLHQLRGRVGRGDAPGKVFVISNTSDKATRARLRKFSNTDDGFELATFDLESRHEGDILGRRQSGIPALKLVNIIRDEAIIVEAHDDALEILSLDPELEAPEHVPLREEISRLMAQADL